MVKVRNVVYNKSLSNKLYLKKQLHGLHTKEETMVLEHLNCFNKIISELLVVGVKIDEEYKVLILFSSLSESYDHIVPAILHRNETLILEEVMTTLLSKEIKKRLNQDEHEGLGLVVMGMKERRKEKYGFVEGIPLLSLGRLLEVGPQVSTRVVEKERANCRDRHSKECIDTYVLIVSILCVSYSFEKNSGSGGGVISFRKQ